MPAGRLRHRVQLQQATEARDAHGQAVKTWTNQATVWAGVEPLRGQEGIVARQVAARANVRIVIRSRIDIDTDWRVVFGTRTYEIEDITNVRYVSAVSSYQELWCSLMT